MRPRIVVPIVSAILLGGCDYFLGAPQKAASILVEPESITVAQLDSAWVRVRVLDGKGGAMPAPRGTSWDSHDYKVATLEHPFGPDADTGAVVIRGYTPGRTSVTVYAQGFFATATVTVTPAEAQVVTVNPGSLSLAVGERRTITVEAFDAKKHRFPYGSATFRARNGRVTVDVNGTVTGAAPGFDTVTVTIGTRSIDIQARVLVEYSAAFLYYKRGDSNVGRATLTFGLPEPGKGKLIIDGKTLTVNVTTDASGRVTCMWSDVARPIPNVDLARCAFDDSPATIRLCTVPNILDQHGVLQYVLLDEGYTTKLPSSKQAMLGAVQASMGAQGLNIYTSCITRTSSPPPESWIRAPRGDYFRWPNVTTVHSAASVESLLVNAAIYTVPGAGLDVSKYVAIMAGALGLEAGIDLGSAAGCRRSVLPIW
jgi:hypothetical protein